MKKISNYDLMRSLKDQYSSAFTERIPAITQSNMEQIGNTLKNYPKIANEFIDVLTNQVIRTMFMTKSLDNPLSVFEKGELEKYGKSLEMIFVDIIKGKDFSERFGTSYENELLAPQKMDNVKVEYLTENSRLKYKITISDDMLSSAFKSENGLSNMINELVAKQVQSYNVDKMLMTMKLLDTIEPGKKIECKQATDHSTTKELIKTLKTVVLNLGFPSREYNKAGVMTKSLAEDLYIVVTNETKANIDVEMLATVFNMDKAKVEGRIISVPYFKDPNRVALVLDKDALQIYSTKFATGTSENVAGLFTNVFLHKWDLLGACSFANVVELRTGGAEELRIDMPYDVIEMGAKDEDGNVVADLTKVEIELDGGEIKKKKEKKLK